MKQYKFKINGNEYTVDIVSVEVDKSMVAVNGANFEVELEGSTAKPATKTPKVARPNTQEVTVPVAQVSPRSTGGAGDIKAPLPGVILSLDVKVGDTVKVGQRLFVLEAMKMENNIDSDKEGTVKEIKVNRGDSVLEGDVIMSIG